jgi:cyclophilin family peptidyl-prolyl cis-trans isomerase
MIDRRAAILAAVLLAAGLMTGRCTMAEDGKPENPSDPIVLISTSLGDIKAELYADKAPITVKNFLAYAKDKHYDGTIFHRVIPGFMIQGGGMNADMKEKSTKSPIKNEAGNGLKNDRGTLAMARTGVVDSATAQFFVNVKTNDFLNHKNDSSQGFGYAVFGKVLEGMAVVDKIVAVPTETRGMQEDVPRDPVVIKSLTVVSEGKP